VRVNLIPHKAKNESPKYTSPPLKVQVDKIDNVTYFAYDSIDIFNKVGQGKISHILLILPGGFGVVRIARLNECQEG
jgi:hypothetical protein